MSSQAEAPQAPPGTPDADPLRWWGLTVIAIAQLMIVLDATIVNIALPTAQADLHISVANRQWVITAYTLAFGGLLLLGGRIGDLFGRKRVFIIGLLGFAVASALGGAAQGQEMLFAARALQGALGAILAPAALSLLTTTFTEPSERGKAFGIYGAIAGGGAAVGLVLGGLLTEFLNWRWCLFVNSPIAIVAALGATRTLRDNLPQAARVRLDFIGVVLGCGGLLAIVYGCTEAETHGWSSPRVLGLLCGGGLLLVLFALFEGRVRNPLLPQHIVRDRNRGGAALTVALAVISLFGTFLFLTYYLQTIKGYSPVIAGVSFLPMTAGIVFTSTQVSSRLLTRIPARMLIVPGLLLVAVGMFMLVFLRAGSSYAAVVLPSEILIGLGMGLVFMPSMSVATSGVRPQDAGVASAVVNTAQQVGGSIGTALLNTIAASAATAYITAHATSPHVSRGLQVTGTVHGYNVASATAACIMLAAAILAAILINHHPDRYEAAARSRREAEAQSAA
ncbi:MFS transporter [Streptomyces sp. PTM05]|uniref:MFS transporter n=1 Tax=Streptantibioticus parmotrematis TaxID=2873249 RepID=A0ABS7R125_9ACTN|nr:MFS transporter [Streptantibioticus parmotrematis]MBY8888619.1 MFS transporter [Streptantibioticus parmotrematis]